MIKPVSEEGLGASRQSDWSCWRANGDGEPLGEGVSAAAESVIVGQVRWIVGGAQVGVNGDPGAKCVCGCVCVCVDGCILGVSLPLVGVAGAGKTAAVAVAACE